MPHSNFLMRSYPKIKRNLDEREKSIDENVRNIARKFEKDFFDGERKYGYGGYKYDGRWIPVVKDFIEFYNLNENSSVLDIGAGKGFMIKDFIDSLPEGLETNIGEKGLKISGGQIQRIGIARALYLDPEFLILDEPTSALDEKSEQEIYKTIRNLRGSVTLLIISHKRNIGDICDEVYILKNKSLNLEKK